MAHDSIIITCLGDIAPVGAAESILMEDTRSHKTHFESLFAKSDIVFGNLESPLTTATTPAEDKKYLLRAHHRVLDAFPEKFVFSIANNHILDYGETGLLDTIDHLSQKGFRFAGAGKNLESAGKPVVIACKGKKIGFLAAADQRYPAATANTPGLFPAAPDLLSQKIEQVRQETDILYVSIHIGMEFIPVPAPAMIDIARQCHQAGAQVVFFHHAHCLSGHTMTPESITLWGTGNFLFPEVMPYHFPPWCKAAAWHIRHPVTESGFSPKMEARIEPLSLTRNGMPKQANAQTGQSIEEQINSLGGKISRGKSMGRMRLANMCKPAYLKIFLFNYADIARRKGLKHTIGQIVAAIKALFLKRA